MSMTLEALLVAFAVNTCGWLIAGYCVKRWADGVVADIKALVAEIKSMVPRSECRDIHNRIHNRIDEIDAKTDSNGERIAGLEVAAGK